MNLGSIMVSFGANIQGFTNGVSQLIAQMNDMNIRMQNMKSSASAFGASMSGITGAVSGVRGAIGGAIGGIQDFAGKTFMAGKVVGEAIFYWKDLIATGFSFVTNLFDQNAAMEQTKIALTGIMGSASGATDMMSKLQAFAAATPFEFPELAKDTQLLMGMGTAAKDVIPTLTAVGDAAAGVGAGSEGVQRLVVALGQMSAKGKISAEDMMQITSLGVPAWKILAQQMHLTTAEVMNLASRGLIPADQGVKDLTAGMEKMYGGQMANQALTFNGLVSTLHDNIGAAYRAFAGPAFDLAKGALNSLTSIMGSPKILEFATNMGKAVGGGLTQFVSFVTTSVVPAVQSFMGWLGQLWAKVSTSGLPALIDSIKNLAGTIMGIGQNALTLIGNLLTSVFGGDKAGPILLINQYILDMANRFNLAAGILQNLIAPFTELSTKGEILRYVLLGLGIAIATFKIGMFLATVPALVGAFIAWAGGAWTAAAGTIAAAAPLLLIAAIIGVVVVIIVLAITHWTQITQVLGAVWSRFTSGAGAEFNQLGTEVRGIIDGIGGVFNGLGEKMNGLKGKIGDGANAIGGFFGGMRDKAGQLKDGVGNAFGGMRDDVGNKMSSMGSNIHGAMSVIGDTMTSAWQSITGNSTSSMGDIVGQVGASFGQLWSNVQSAMGNVRDTISNVWNGIVGIVQGVAGSILNALTGPFNDAYNMISGILGNIGAAVSGTLGWIGGLISNVQSGLAGIHVPGFATGVENFSGGLAMVGEAGPELLYLPQGSSVKPINSVSSYNPTPIQSNNGGGGNATYILQLDGRELARALGPHLAQEVHLTLGVI